jgi:2-hydroxy-6-oxonona-2,4-dienedioate hydrolase
MWTDLNGVQFEQKWVEAGGIATRALMSGHGQDEALIFLHGTGGHAEAFGRNLRAHGRRFRTYAIDLVGHGYSDKPRIAYEISDYVKQVVDFLDAEGIERTAISGESLGGWVAARLAAQCPERVTKLVLNTAGGLTADPPVMAAIRRLTLEAVESPTEEMIRRRLEWLMADPQRVTPELVAVRQAIYSQAAFRAVIERILCLQDMEVRTRNLLSAPELSSIEAPTLVVWTTHDPTAGIEVGKRFVQLIHGARMVVMSGCGHWPQFESAAEFDRIHIDFLTDGT